MTTMLSPGSEESLYARVRDLVVGARQTVARGVDLVQVRTNFEIGRHIVEFEQLGADRAVYGGELLTVLAERLSAEFGKGFARSNIAYMRSFYLVYRHRSAIVQTASGQLQDSLAQQEAADFLIVQTSSGQSDGHKSSLRSFSLSWSHYVFLLGVKNPDERSFYEIEATSQSWTVRELKRQFDTSLYERLALSRDKAGTIGIVLCKRKHEALVEITLPKDANIHAREYQLYLPSKEELQQKLQEWAGDLGDLEDADAPNDGEVEQ